MGTNDHSSETILAVAHAWEQALADHDVEALLACYAQDATWKVRSRHTCSAAVASCAGTPNYGRS